MDNYNNYNNENNSKDESFVFVEGKSGNERFSNTWTTVQYEPVVPKKTKNRKAMGRVAGIIAGALVCALLGGVVGAGGVYYLNDKGLINQGSTSTATSTTKTLYHDAPTFTSTQGAMSVTDVVKKVSPAVVTVSTKSVQNGGIFGAGISEGVGSGFIINEEGNILTNFHVISGAQQVKVTFSDGKEVNAKVINYDQKQDIAVLKVTDNVKMPAVVTLGDSDAVQAGEEVIAIGNPLGKEFVGTVTKGIVSSPARTIEINGQQATYIQTDAAINPGNSGGPLINSKGEVIGINAAKESSTSNGTSVEGIGFSIPINIVKEQLSTLSKPILRLGIQIQNIDAETAKAYNLVEGIYVADVEDFSVAQKGGLKIGDVITKYNGKTVKTADELNKLKNAQKAGDVIKLTVVRNGKEIVLEMTLQE